MRFLLSIILIIIFIAVCWLIYTQYFTSHSPMHDPFKLYVIDKATDEIARSIDTPLVPGVIAIFPLVADHQNTITKYLAHKLDNSGKYKTIPIDEILSYCQKESISTKSLIRNKIIQVAQHFSSDICAYGKVVAFSKTKQLSTIKIRITLYHLKKKKYIYKEKMFSGTLQKGITFAYYKAWVCSQSPWSRILIWFAITISIPFFFFKTILKNLEKESNATNFKLLLIFTLFSIFCSLLLSGFSITTFMDVFSIILVFFIAMSYNYIVLSWFEYQRN